MKVARLSKLLPARFRFSQSNELDALLRLAAPIQMSHVLHEFGESESRITNHFFHKLKILWLVVWLVVWLVDMTGSNLRNDNCRINAGKPLRARRDSNP